MVVVIHGVGAHEPVDIVRAAGDGFLRADWPDVWIARARIGGLPDLGARREALAALHVRSPEGSHVVLPWVWSGLRMRARDVLETDAGEPLLRGPRSLVRMLGLLAQSSWTALRAVPAGRCGVGWLTALTGAGVLAASVVALAWLLLVAIGWLATAILWLTNAAPTAVGTVPPFVLFAIGMLLLAIVASRVLAPADTLGDIVDWLGAPEHRAGAVRRLTAFLEAIAGRAPNAQLLVVGHSLGSVLVTHALQSVAEPSPLWGRTTCLTLGSPLRTMSWLFPRAVVAPVPLAQALCGHGVREWWHGWRDYDMVGRALFAEAPVGCRQESLGRGGHAYYWREPELWAAVADLLRGRPRPTVEPRTTIWSRVTGLDATPLLALGPLALVVAVGWFGREATDVAVAIGERAGSTLVAAWSGPVRHAMTVLEPSERFGMRPVGPVPPSLAGEDERK